MSAWTVLLSLGRDFTACCGSTRSGAFAAVSGYRHESVHQAAGGAGWLCRPAHRRGRTRRSRGQGAAPGFAALTDSTPRGGGCHPPAPSERVIGWISRAVPAQTVIDRGERLLRVGQGFRGGHLEAAGPGGETWGLRGAGGLLGGTGGHAPEASRPLRAFEVRPWMQDMTSRPRPWMDCQRQQRRACARPRPCWQGRRVDVGGEPGLANLRPRRTRSSSASGLLALKAVLLAAHRVVRSPDTSRASHVGLKSALGRVGCWSGARAQGSGPPP